MDPEETYEIRTVASDLGFLKRAWGSRSSDDDIRRSSTVLRQLLVQGHYSRAWRKLGFANEPQVAAVDLDAHVSGIPLAAIGFASAGGANFRGIQAIGLIMVDQSKLPNPNPVAHDAAVTSFPVSAFLRSTALVYAGQKISRQSVISYVANELGGAHLGQSPRGDRKQKAAFQHLRALAGGRRRGELPNHATDAVHHELRSIGQALANSADAQRFIEEAAHHPEKATEK